MVCRTPGSSELTPLRMSEDNLDLRDLNASYPAPTLRLVSLDTEIERNADNGLLAAPTYDAWQYMPREVREHKVAVARQRRTLARRKQAKRVEKLVFHTAAAAACVVALVGSGHLAVSNYSSPNHYVKVIVAPGDTLWTVASRYTASGSATISTVGSIRLANPELTGTAPLRIGEQIFVPAPRG